VAEIRIKAARCPVGVAPGDEALIENLPPGMEVHRLIDVVLVEISFQPRQSVRRDARGSAGKGGPVWMVVEYLFRSEKDIVFGPDKGLGKE
jgi:hypothetical protein